MVWNPIRPMGGLPRWTFLWMDVFALTPQDAPAMMQRLEAPLRSATSEMRGVATTPANSSPLVIGKKGPQVEPPLLCPNALCALPRLLFKVSWKKCVTHECQSQQASTRSAKTWCLRGATRLFRPHPHKACWTNCNVSSCQFQQAPTQPGKTNVLAWCSLVFCQKCKRSIGTIAPCTNVNPNRHQPDLQTNGVCAGATRLFRPEPRKACWTNRDVS